MRPFALFLLLLVSTLLLSRLGLSIWQIDRVDSFQSFITLLINGARVDLSTIGYLLILPALIHPWIMLRSKVAAWWLKALSILFFCIFVSVLLLMNMVFVLIDYLLNIWPILTK